MYEKLKDLMYNMFLDGAFPDLEMEDFEVMWLAIVERWEIKKPKLWDEFIEEVNCPYSNKYTWFSNVFDKYFQ